MATATGTYIAVDEIRATLGSTTANYVSELRATGDTTTAQLVRRMWLNDSSNILTMVWDVWETILRAYDFTMDSSGGNVEDYLSVTSYGTDVEGDSYDLGYTVDPDYLDPNEYEDDIYETITITQEGTGESIEVEAVIAGRKVSEVLYNRPTVTEYWIDDVSAVGDKTVYLIVGWEQVITTVYDNDTYEDTTVTGSSVAAVVSGSSTIGAYIDDEGVFVPNAGTDYYTSDRIAYTIKKFSFYASDEDPEEYTFTQTIYVYQNANNREASDTEYQVYYDSLSTDYIANTGGTFSFVAHCESRTLYTYDSGAEKYGEWSGASGRISFDSSTGVTKVSKTSFTDYATITATVGENFEGERYPLVTIYAYADSDVSEDIEVTQEEVFIEFESESLPTIVGAEGGTISFFITCRRNGKYWTFTEDNVMVSGISGTSVDVTHEGDGEYSIIVDVPSHTSTSSRNFTVIASRPDEDDTIEWEVTQKGVVVEREKYRIVSKAYSLDSAISEVFYDLTIDAEDTTKYKGGYVGDVTVELNRTSSGSASAVRTSLASDLYVEEGDYANFQGYLLNTGINPVYFIVRFDGVVVDSKPILAPQ